VNSSTDENLFETVGGENFTLKVGAKSSSGAKCSLKDQAEAVPSSIMFMFIFCRSYVKHLQIPRQPVIFRAFTF
jgi:hypothetical protein